MKILYVLFSEEVVSSVVGLVYKSVKVFVQSHLGRYLECKSGILACSLTFALLLLTLRGQNVAHPVVVTLPQGPAIINRHCVQTGALHQ